jgi:ubiquinone/menaquinone biosynthesis C-methylase UbiE
MYVLGHSDSELERLDLQGVLYRDATRRAFVDAGVAPGMAVLDVGCGTGDVSLLAAELVGPGGSVIGVDREADAVEAARARAEARGAANVEFRVAEIGEGVEAASVDALVGRFVLMHQDDPARALGRAARAVRPGGSVAMVESNMTSLLDAPHSWPQSPLYDRIVRWKCSVVGGAGADLEAGLRLARTFVDAGLPEPATRLEALVVGGSETPFYRYMAESVRSMLPAARRLGVMGFNESDVDALAGELRAEVVASHGVLVCWPVVAAWCRT